MIASSGFTGTRVDHPILLQEALDVLITNPDLLFLLLGYLHYVLENRVYLSVLWGGTVTTFKFDVRHLMHLLLVLRVACVQVALQFVL